MTLSPEERDEPNCARCGLPAIGHDDSPCKWTEADVVRQHLRVAQAEVARLTVALQAVTEDAERWRASQARKFPIQDGPDIPWTAIAPFEKQALRNHSQTLERLAERGGLSVYEALATIKGFRLWGPEWNDLVRHPLPLAIRALVELTSARAALPTEDTKR